MAFDVRALKQRDEEIKGDAGYFRMTGRVFGEESDCPMKAEVSVGGGKWSRSFTQGNQRHSAKMSFKERQEFAQNSMNPMTFDPDAIEKGNRLAISETGCLLTVSFAGPVFEDYADYIRWIEGDAEVLVNGEPWLAPDDANEIFKMTSEGQVLFPTQQRIPDAWDLIASDGDIQQLRGMEDFLSQIAGFRNLLERTGLESEEDDLGNLPDLPSTPSPGTRSAKKSK